MGSATTQWLTTSDLKWEQIFFTVLFFIVRAVTSQLKIIDEWWNFSKTTASPGNRLTHGIISRDGTQTWGQTTLTSPKGWLIK